MLPGCPSSCFSYLRAGSPLSSVLLLSLHPPRCSPTASFAPLRCCTSSAAPGPAVKRQAPAWLPVCGARDDSKCATDECALRVAAAPAVRILQSLCAVRDPSCWRARGAAAERPVQSIEVQASSSATACCCLPVSRRLQVVCPNMPTKYKSTSTRQRSGRLIDPKPTKSTPKH